jgi:hypothetical protein
MLLIAILTTLKVYKGSKSSFAYTLLAFTYAYSVVIFAMVLVYSFPQEVNID